MDRPLLSRRRWTLENALIAACWLASCVVAGFAVVMLTDGTWEWLALGVVFLIASPLVEAPFAFRKGDYDEYARQWEQENRGRSEA